MIATSTAAANRPSSFAHPTNVQFGLRAGNSRSIVSSELNVKI